MLPECGVGLVRMINFQVISINAITTKGHKRSSLTAREGLALRWPVGEKQASTPALLGLLSRARGLTTLPVEA